MTDSLTAGVSAAKIFNKENECGSHRMLVTYSMPSTFTSTTAEYLNAFKRYSSFKIDYVHVTHDAWMDFDINRYDVVFHSYCARLCFEGLVSPSYERAMNSFLGIKMLAVQDEYDLTATLHQAIRRLGFHVLFTCVPKAYWPLAYPKSELPGVELVHVLTGYVPDDLDSRQRHIRPLNKRSKRIAYRGRNIGARYGRLGFEKYEIGRRMAAVCDTKGVPHDIAMDEASRIYGDGWFDFLGDCRTMLGSESGSNAFDFDGRLKALVAEADTTLKRTATYEEMIATVAPFEKPFDIGQISPRVFECAAMMTPMIMYRGGYSGAIEPDIHYIALEKDFSNVDAILSKLDDLDWLQGFANRAHAKLVASGDFSYKAFVGLIEQTARASYARHIDPNFVEYRRETMPDWLPTKPSKTPTTVEEAEHIAFGEFPTDQLLDSEVFKARQDEFNRLSRWLELQDALMNLMSAVGKLMFVLARPMWRLLPKEIRDRVARRLGYG